mgnify:FL=1
MITYLDTSSRMVAAGVASAAGLILLPLMLVTNRNQDESGIWMIPAQGLGLAVGISVLLRTLNYTIDPTLTGDFGWFGWLLAIGFGLTLVYFKWEPKEDPPTAIK